MVDTSSRSPRRIDLSAGWRSRLAIGTTGGLAFLAMSGLLIWWGPFSRLTQVSVLLHTSLALLFFLPIAWYCVRHWLRYRQHPLTHVKLLGYLGVFTLAACAISGVLLTTEPIVSHRISYLWRAVHEWTTLLLLAFVAPHIVLILLRDTGGRVTGALAPVCEARRRFGRGTLHWVVLPSAFVLLVCFAYAPPPLQQSFPAGYELWQAHDAVYARNRPFAPSMARTVDNRPIDARMLSGSESCGTSGCHEQIVQEWKPSAHRYAAMDKAFQAVQLTMARQNGPASTRYCGGCHDPISLFSGAKNVYTEEAKLTGAQGFHEGVSCLACHSIKKTDLRGNANFIVTSPPRYIGELEYDATHQRSWRWVRDFLIRAYPRQHLASLSKVMYKKPEYCAACHKQFVDQEINKVGWVQLQNQYDNWRMSKWARHQADARHTIECRECHMPLVPSRDPAAGDPYDYNRTADDHRHRSHRFIAANQFLPALLKLEGADEQLRLTHQWLKGQMAIPEIEKKWYKPGVPAVAIHLDAPATVHPGEPVRVQCIVTSNKVGHDFPSGPLDIIQAWLEVTARDAAGHVVYETGAVDRRGFIQRGSFMFKAEPVDQNGNLIDRHNLWDMVGVRNRRNLFPGFSDTAEFSFLCPELKPSKRPLLPAAKQFAFTAPHTGALTVTVRLRYRKIDQFLLDYIRTVGYFREFKGQSLTAPITDMDVQSTVVQVEPGPAAVAKGKPQGARVAARTAGSRAIQRAGL